MELLFTRVNVKTASFCYGRCLFVIDLNYGLFEMQWMWNPTYILFPSGRSWTLSGKGRLSLLYGAAARKSSWGPKTAEFACPALYQRSREEGIITARGAPLQCVCGTWWVLFKLPGPVFPHAFSLGMHKELLNPSSVLFPFWFPPNLLRLVTS